MYDNYDDDMLMVMSFLSMIWPAVCWLSFAHFIPVYLIIYEETSVFSDTTLDESIIAQSNF